MLSTSFLPHLLVHVMLYLPIELCPLTAALCDYLILISSCFNDITPFHSVLCDYPLLLQQYLIYSSHPPLRHSIFASFLPSCCTRTMCGAACTDVVATLSTVFTSNFPDRRIAPVSVLFSSQFPCLWSFGLLVREVIKKNS